MLVLWFGGLSQIIVDGFVGKALKERHYSGGTQLYKQTFEAFIRFKCKSLGKDFQLDFISKMKKLREETTLTNLLAVCNDENFKQIKQPIFDHSGIMGKWVTDSIRDVINFIAAYRDRNIELHF